MSLGINKWAVVGHSFGGMVALEYAIRFPQALTHLCILDSCGDGRVVRENTSRILKQRGFGKISIETAERFFSGQIGKNGLVKSLIILAKAYYSKPSFGFPHRNPIAFIHGFRELIPGWSIMSEAKRIEVPCLIMAGRDDFQFPPEDQRLLAAGIRGAELRIVEGAGHNAHIEKAKEVLSIVRSFLRN